MAMSKKRLYIHIGTQKTGSTTIQRFLSENMRMLRKQGVLYPEFIRPSGRNHNRLISERSSTSHKLVKKIFDDKEIVSLKEKFDSEVKASGAERIILSSEDLFLPLEQQQWKLLKSLCQGYEVFIIVYFRRQDEFLISLHNQRVKDSLSIKGSFLETLEQEQVLFKSLLDNYENVLSAWSDIAEDNHILVTAYEGDVKRDVLGHFLDSVGIEYHDEMSKPEKRKNASIPYTLVKLKSLMNSCMVENDPSYKELCSIDFTQLSDLLATLRTNEKRAELSPLSPQKRLSIIKEYEEMNQRIAKRYLAKDKLFEAPLPEEDEAFDEMTTLSVDELIDIVGIFFVHYMQNYNELASLRRVSRRMAKARKALSRLKRKLFFLSTSS